MVQYLDISTHSTIECPKRENYLVAAFVVFEVKENLFYNTSDIIMHLYICRTLKECNDLFKGKVIPHLHKLLSLRQCEIILSFPQKPYLWHLTRSNILTIRQTVGAKVP